MGTGIQVKALVAHESGGDLQVEEVQLREPGPNEVRVRIRAAGVCHSDLSMVNGTLRPPFPLVLGHEAAGEVLEVGPGVDRVKPGDHVVLNWQPACRKCWFCQRGEPWLCENVAGPAVERGTTADGTALNVVLGLGSLAEQVVVRDVAVIPVPAELPYEYAALLGCAVVTGFGAVRNTATVTTGDSALVIGLGGVGLSVVAAARTAGADPVIAVDVSTAKRDLAIDLGATHFIVSDDSLAAAVRELTGGRGVDHAFECVGRASTITAAWRCTRRGGHVVVVGMGALKDNVSLSALDIFHSGRILQSALYGTSDPDREVPALARAVLDGTLDPRPLISHRIGLADTPAAFERLTRGEGVRSVVLFDD
jgi:S-(hydroxymethyl)glutathione dehydrogenase / alcohol dehydrogenase